MNQRHWVKMHEDLSIVDSGECESEMGVEFCGSAACRHFTV